MQEAWGHSYSSMYICFFLCFRLTKKKTLMWSYASAHANWPCLLTNTSLACGLGWLIDTHPRVHARWRCDCLPQSRQVLLWNSSQCLFNRIFIAKYCLCHPLSVASAQAVSHFPEVASSGPQNFWLVNWCHQCGCSTSYIPPTDAQKNEVCWQRNSWRLPGACSAFPECQS